MNMKKIIGTEKNNVIFVETNLTDNKFVCDFTKYEPVTPDWLEDECQIRFEWMEFADRYVLCERYHSAPQELIKNMPFDKKIEMATGTETKIEIYHFDSDVWYLLDVTDYQSVIPDNIENIVINQKTLEDLINFDRKYDRKDKVFPKSKIKAYEEIVSELERINNAEVFRKMIEKNIIKPPKH